MKKKFCKTCLDSLKSSGITIKQMEERTLRTKDNVLKCLWNGLIIFLFSAGLTGMFSAAFDLPCIYPFVAAVCAFFAFSFAFLYVNSLSYNLGYFLLMFLIIFIIVSFGVFINSGFNAVLNIMSKAAKEEMNLPYYREHLEYYGNRQITVTAFMSMAGCVLAMFFNMWVSRRKSILVPLLVMFPVFEISIYLNDGFSYISMAAILLAAVLFVITSHNDPIPMNRKKMQNPWHAYFSKKRESGQKEITVVLHQDKPERKGSMAAAFVYTVAALLVSLLFFGFIPKNFVKSDSVLKKTTDRVVKTVTLQGMEGLFLKNSNIGTGGMSNGSFGKVSSVYLDYENDLLITLVPYTDAPVYLSTYTGAVYDAKKGRWTNDGIDAKYGYEESNALVKRIWDSGDRDKYKVTSVSMLIKNVGVRYSTPSPSGEGGFSGYYSTSDMQIPLAVSEDDYTELNYYACLLGYDEYSKLDAFSPENAEIVSVGSENAEIVSGGSENAEIVSGGSGDAELLSAYTKVPDNIRHALSEICEDEGFGGSKTQIIRQIQAYLAANCQYTVAPGRLPSNRDFVLYFLLEKKEGFCVHFASSACLLLRTMGIPARYAEGYCFDYTVYEDAELYGGERTDWNEGYSVLDYDKPVNIELTDANAHAWVEVYFDEIGWVPVEFTVGTVADDGSLGIMDFLGSLFSFAGSVTNPDSNASGENFFINAGNAIQNWFESRFGEQMLIILGILFAFLLLKYGIYVFRAYFSKPGYRAVFQYRTLTRRVRKRLMRRHRDKYDYYGRLIISYDVMRALLAEEYGLPRSYIDGVMSAYERFNYSGRESDRNIKELTRLYRGLVFSLVLGRKHCGKEVNYS